jgi:hypothetical protein
MKSHRKALHEFTTHILQKLTWKWSTLHAPFSLRLPPLPPRDNRVSERSGAPPPHSLLHGYHVPLRLDPYLNGTVCRRAIRPLATRVRLTLSHATSKTFIFYNTYFASTFGTPSSTGVRALCPASPPNRATAFRLHKHLASLSRKTCAR